MRGGDIVFIDTPPHAQPTINIAADVAEACLLVTGPYPEDLERDDFRSDHILSS